MKTEPRNLREINGSLYLLVESPVAKVLELDKERPVFVEVYYSDKHQDKYLAMYQKDKEPQKLDPEEEQVIEQATEKHT